MDYEDLDNSSPPPPDGEVAMQLVHLSNVSGCGNEIGEIGEIAYSSIIISGSHDRVLCVLDRRRGCCVWRKRAEC